MMYNTTTELFKGICDAVRDKDCTTGLINHQDIPARIAAISGGGEEFISSFYTYRGSGLKIENMVASNFDYNSSIYLPNAFLPGNSAWQIQVKFRLDQNSVKSRNFIIGSTSNPNILDVPYLTVRDNNTAIGAGIPDGQNNFGENAVSDYAFLIDTDYFVKLIYDLLKYKVCISTDGKSFENILEINYSEAMQQSNSVMKFGSYGLETNANNLSGSIDLKETYIKIGDEVWWGRGVEA